MARASRRIRRTALFGLLLVLSACLAAAPAAGAKNVVKLKKAGQTVVKLSSAASKGLKSAGVTAKPVGSAKAKSGGIAFPISGGTLDPQLKDGASISHSGGMSLSKGSTTVTLSNPRITIGAGGSSLSVAIGGASGAIFTLDTSKAKIVRRSPVGSWGADGIGLRLNAKGAKALNSKFKTKFKSGDAFGTAAVTAKLAELIISAGETTITLGSAYTTLTTAGLITQPIAPATLSGVVVKLPISPSKISANFSSGTILLSGGLTFSKDTTVIRNESYEIRLGGSPTVAATVNGAAPKLDVLDLDLSNVSQSGTQPVRLKGIVVKLNAASAAGLSTAAGVNPPLAAGTPAGTAAISMNIR